MEMKIALKQSRQKDGKKTERVIVCIRWTDRGKGKDGNRHRKRKKEAEASRTHLKQIKSVRHPNIGSVACLRSGARMRSAYWDLCYVRAQCTGP